MAIATAGGMTTSTVLTLFVVPCVYAYMDRFSGWLRRDRDKHARMEGLEQES
jgi:Cu/Ag efflux pump CusA